MNKYQQVRQRMKFEPVPGSKNVFWIKCQHHERGEIKCLSQNIKARDFIERVDSGRLIADRSYTNYVIDLWSEVCEKSGVPTTLPYIIRSLKDLVYAMNNKIQFNYGELLSTGFIQDIPDPTSKYVCRKDKAMIYRTSNGSYSTCPYDGDKIKQYLKSLKG